MNIRRVLTEPINWTKDDLLRRLFKNAGILLTGSITASALQLASLAITARALGPEAFGILTLVVSYIVIVDGLFNFQSWQFVVKYGAGKLDVQNNNDLKFLIKFGLILDVAAASLGCFAALAGIYLSAAWMDWSKELEVTLLIYSGTIIFRITGTMTGLLRITGSFRALAAHQFLGALVRLLGVIVAFSENWSLWGFISVWAVSDIFTQLLLIWFGARELRRRHIRGISRQSVRGASVKFRGIWSFIWATNLSGAIRNGTRELDTMILGVALGPASAGMYKIAKQYSLSIVKLSDPLYQVIFPDLSALYRERRLQGFLSLMWRSSCLAGGGATLIWVAFVFFGTFLISVTAGQSYISAYGVMVVHMLGSVIAIFSFPLQPGMLAMGQAKTSFYVHLFCSLAHPLVLWGCLNLGLLGAGVAYVIYTLVWASLMLLNISQNLKQGERE